MEENQTIIERRSFPDQARSIWNDFGPFIVGVLVLLVVLSGVWYLWNKRNEIKNSENSTVVEETNQTGGTVPVSGLTLASPSPTPVATSTPTPTATPQVLATTKGGKALPKTGPEEVYGLVSLASIAGGIYLRRLSKKF